MPTDICTPGLRFFVWFCDLCVVTAHIYEGDNFDCVETILFGRIVPS